MFGWGSIPDRENHIICSPSALLAFRQDPEVYKMRYIDKEEYTTDSMEFGTLVHLYVLQYEKFCEEYALLPEKTAENDFDSDALKAICKELGEKVTGTKRELAQRIRAHRPDFIIYEEIIDVIQSEGKKSISPAVFKKLSAIREKIMAHPKVGKWLELAEKEKLGYWQDSETGIVMPFVADGFFNHKGVGVALDLKITRDFDPRRFSNNMYDNGYFIQAAAYCEAISAIQGELFENFLFITVEPSAPHRVRFLQLDSAALEAGRKSLKKYLREFKERWTAQDWSARPMDIEIQQVSLASWSWQKDEFNDEGEL